MNLEKCTNFVQVFDRYAQSSKKCYITQGDSLSNQKPLFYKTKQITERSKSCIEFLKTTKELERSECFDKLTKLSQALDAYSIAIVNSIKKRWWYSILHFFGYKAHPTKDLVEITHLAKIALQQLKIAKTESVVSVHPPRKKEYERDLVRENAIELAARRQLKLVFNQIKSEVFQEYTLKLRWNQKEEEILVRSKEEQKLLIERLSKEHRIIEVRELPEKSDELAPYLKNRLTAFEECFEIKSDCLFPKMLKVTNHESGNTDVEYVNGVMEVRYKDQDVRKRTFPNGSIIEGEFNYYRELDVWSGSYGIQTGYRSVDGKKTFYNPTCIGTKSTEVNFADVVCDGSKQLFVLKYDKETDTHSEFTGTLEEAFISYLIGGGNSDILYSLLGTKFLYPCLASLFQLSQQTSQYPIFLLTRNQVLNMLDFCSMVGLPENGLDILDTSTNQNLYQKWMNDSAIMEKILILSPALVLKDNSFESCAVLLNYLSLTLNLEKVFAHPNCPLKAQTFFDYLFQVNNPLVLKLDLNIMTSALTLAKKLNIPVSFSL